jgi:hypothetical protein
MSVLYSRSQKYQRPYEMDPALDCRLRRSWDESSWIRFPEAGGIHHNPTVSHHLIRSVFGHLKAVAFAVAVVTTDQRD